MGQKPEVLRQKKVREVRSLAGKFVRVVSWLCFEHEWARWELLTIAAIALLLLLFVLRLLRKGAAARAQAVLLPERSPIIGLRLADHKRSHHEIAGSQKSRSVRRGHAKQKDRKTTRHLEKLNRQIEQLQREVTERKQTEARLEQRVAEFTKAGKTLRPDDVKPGQTDGHVEQQLAELTAANKQLRDELAKHRDHQTGLEKQIAELKATNEQFRRPPLELKQPENIPVKSAERRPKSRRHDGPLNVDELSRLAELGKRLAPRRSS
jgi:prefoldin subunit 5